MTKDEEEFNFDSIQESLEQFSKAAARGDNAPNNLDILQRGYYEAIKDVYKAYNSNAISLDDAKAAKSKLQREYFDYVKDKNDAVAVYIARQEDIKKTNEIRTKICKATSISEIADLAVKGISILTNDEVVYKTFKQNTAKINSKGSN